MGFHKVHGYIGLWLFQTEQLVYELSYFLHGTAHDSAHLDGTTCSCSKLNSWCMNCLTFYMERPMTVLI